MVSGPDGSAHPATTPELPLSSAGVEKLIRGDPSQTASQEDPFGSLVLEPWVLPITLLATDLMLCVLTALLLLAGPTRPGFGKITLCFLALALGAWLGCLALWMLYQPSPSSQSIPDLPETIPAPPPPPPPVAEPEPVNPQPESAPAPKAAFRSTVMPSNRRSSL